MMRLKKANCTMIRLFLVQFAFRFVLFAFYSLEVSGLKAFQPWARISIS